MIFWKSEINFEIKTQNRNKKVKRNKKIGGATNPKLIFREKNKIEIKKDIENRGRHDPHMGWPITALKMGKKKDKKKHATV